MRIANLSCRAVQMLHGFFEGAAPAAVITCHLIKGWKTEHGLINGAVLLHIRIRDQATNRVGSITIPIEKQ
jgi:hypothetical protein